MGATDHDSLGSNSPIFVSYARANLESVFPIVEQLRAEGFSLWIDLEGIEGAAFWRKEIVRAIGRAHVVLFFASRASCVSENIAKELALASEDRKDILPVFLEDVDLPSELRYQLAGLQRISWHKDPRAAFEQVRVALRRLLRDQTLRPASAVVPTGIAGALRARRSVIAGAGSVLASVGALGAWGLWHAREDAQGLSENQDVSGKKSTQATERSDAPAVLLRAAVLGNQHYSESARLMNPIADARTVAQHLRGQHFEVTELIDLTEAETRTRMARFYGVTEPLTRGISVAKRAPKPAVYFFFYSGHAQVVGNQLCIIPVDADTTSEERIRESAIPVRDVLAPKYGINPRNQITLYSSAPGQPSYDSSGSDNSPFTESFIRHLQNQELDVTTFFAAVTRDVRHSTGDKQAPWIEGSLDGPLYLGNIKRTSLEGTTLISVIDACRTEGN